jgi:hypothetical protein
MGEKETRVTRLKIRSAVSTAISVHSLFDRCQPCVQSTLLRTSIYPRVRRKCSFVFKRSCDCLVVFTVGLALGIKDSRPVLSLKVQLVVDIDLDLEHTFSLLDGEGGDSGGVEKSSEQFSNSRGAPGSYNLSSLEGEFGSKDGIRNSSVGTDLSERKRLVHWGALVSECVDRSTGVDDDADSKTTSNTRGGPAGFRELRGGNAVYIFHIRLILGH